MYKGGAALSSIRPWAWCVQERVCMCNVCSGGGVDVVAFSAVEILDLFMLRSRVGFM